MLAIACGTCGRDFEAQRSTARFCSRSCQPSRVPQTEEQREQARIRNRRYYQRVKAENPEAHKARLQRDNAAAKQRGWPSQKRYTEAHPEQLRERERRWRAEHPETYSAQKLRARYKANGGDTSEADRIDLFSLIARDEGRCGICQETVDFDEASIDHIMAISRGGSHKWENVQLAHISCNSRKGAR